MGNTGADFHKAFESSCSTFIYIFVLCENRSSLSLTLCVLWLSPELEFEERNEKKELNTRNSANFLLDQERSVVGRTMARAHTDGLAHSDRLADENGTRDSVEVEISALRIH